MNCKACGSVRFALSSTASHTGLLCDATLYASEGARLCGLRGLPRYSLLSVPYILYSDSPTVEEMAPRTAMGVRANGTLLLLVVDGEEDIKAGASLYMMQVQHHARLFEWHWSQLVPSGWFGLYMMQV